MPLLISCDRYHITDNGTITIPITSADVDILGPEANKSWVIISDEIANNPGSRYDREENIEDIMRVNAAFAHTDDIYLTSPMDLPNSMTPRHATRYFYDNDTDTIVTRPLNKPESIDPNARVIGPLGTYYSAVIADLFSNPDKYAFKDHLADFFGRETIVVDTQSMNDTDIDKLAYMVENNHQLFIKDALSKGPTGIISTTKLHQTMLSVDFDAETYEDMLTSAITADLNFESWVWGLPRYLFIQEVIPMQYETRFFYVDGRLISTSGRIIDLVPSYQGLSDPFYCADYAVKNHSHGGDGQVPERNPHYREMYDLAQSINAAWSSNEDHATTCTVDIAWDAAHKRAVLVECNSISNSGLYGANVHAIYAALLDTTNGYQGLTYAYMRDTFKEFYTSNHTKVV